MPFPTHVEAEGKPNKKSKKGGAKGSVAILKQCIQLGCVSHNSYPRKSVPREPGKLGTNRAIKFSKGTWHQIKIRERKGPSQDIFQKCAPAQSLRAKTLMPERCARKAACGEKFFQVKNSYKAPYIFRRDQKSENS